MRSEPEFRRGRRVKRFSCRPLKLTDAQQADVEKWLEIPHTLAGKAKQLGITRQTLSTYINKRHKPRKEELDAVMDGLSLQICKVSREPECTQNQL